MNVRAIQFTLLSVMMLCHGQLSTADTSQNPSASLLDFFGPQPTTMPVSNSSIPSNVVPSTTPFTTTSITTGVQPQPQTSLPSQASGAADTNPEPTALSVTTPTSTSPTVLPEQTTTSSQQSPTGGILPMPLSVLSSQSTSLPTVATATTPDIPAASPSTTVQATTPPTETITPPIPPSTVATPVQPAVANTTSPSLAVPSAATPSPTPAALPSQPQNQPPQQLLPPATSSAPSVSQPIDTGYSGYLNTFSPQQPQKKKPASQHELLEFVAEEVITPDEAPQDVLTASAYLGSYLEPWRNIPDEKIEFFFENAELSALISFIEQKFDITFLLDDSIQPLPKGGKSIIGSKISFKTHTPLDKKAAWDIFVSFLDINGLSPVPGPQPRVYRLIGSKEKDAGRSPLPTLIGIDSSFIPDNDTLIRYVYFVENNTIDIIERTIDVMKSVSAPGIIRFAALNALIITDRASNIKAMLAVIQELDNPERQEALAIIKLKYSDASAAKKLYDSLAQGSSATASAARPASSRKHATADYFNKTTRVIAEPRSNSLIVIGTRDAIKIITEFIEQNVDVPDILPDVPRYIYTLKFLEAVHLAKILQDAVAFKTESEAARNGGVRDGDRYFKPITIVPEPTTNSLIINADYEDYSKLYTLLQSIDVEQPQIALRLFLININLTDTKAFGVQLRNKIPGANSLLGDQVNFQTSNLAGTGGSGTIQERSTPPPPPVSGATQLLGNLVNLANFASLGSTVLTLGSDAFGVWGILNMLQTFSQANVVANPFLVTTNKYPAQFVSGDIRRVTDATIFGQQTQQSIRDDTATLDIRITPQISREDNLVTLDIAISFEQFVVADPTSSNGNKTARRLETTVVVANNEVLALGGLMTETVNEAVTKVPVLGDIPLLGWLFQNRSKVLTRSSILVLIIPEIIHAKERIGADILTSEMVHDAKSATREIRSMNNIRDPINRLFFKDNVDAQGEAIDEFMSDRNSYLPDAMDRLSLEEKRHREKLELEPCSNRGKKRKKNKAKSCTPTQSNVKINNVGPDMSRTNAKYSAPDTAPNNTTKRLAGSPEVSLTVPGE